jgi:hypothetical protein
MASALPAVTRWTPTIVEVLRQVGVPERDIPQYTAVTLALIHYESRGNPDAQEGRTGAYGLTQQIKRWHPQHRGNPRAHLLHFATRMRVNTKPGGAASGSPQSFLQAWASGPRALAYFVDTGKIPASPPQFFRQVRNIQDMTAGSTWAAYSSYVHGWIAAGHPTNGTTIDGKTLEMSPPTVATGGPLASTSDGRLYWKGKSRKIGAAGPGGVTGLTVGTAGTSMPRTTLIALALLGVAGIWVFWRAAK